MKLSEDTITLLKNFSSINPSILFRPGNILTTLQANRSIAAKATVAEMFPREVAIYDLSQFLSVLSLFKEPELEFGDKQVTIGTGRHRVSYTYAEPSMIKAAPADMNIPFPADAVSFSLTSDVLNTLIKALNVLQLAEVAIEGDGETIRMGTNNSKDDTASSYSVEVGSADKAFKIVLKSEHFKLLTRDYDVTVAGNVTRFVSNDLTYWLVNEHNSKF